MEKREITTLATSITYDSMTSEFCGNSYSQSGFNKFRHFVRLKVTPSIQKKRHEGKIYSRHNIDRLSVPQFLQNVQVDPFILAPRIADICIPFFFL